MERRNFVRVAAAGAIGAAAGAVGGARIGAARGGTQGATAMAGAEMLQEVAPNPKMQVFPDVQRMVVGCQSRSNTSQQSLEFLARHGVYYMDPGSPRTIEGVGWDLDHAKQQVEEAAKYGIRIGAYHLPLSSAGIERVSVPNIMLGKSPGRDREIEMIQQMISVAGQAGVPMLLYNTTILPILRTGRTPDPARGNVTYSTWNYEQAVAEGQHEGLLVGEVVDVDTVYERITYLLDRILPVAEEYNVRLANHIADPPAPAGYQGITRWNSPDVFAGIQRFAQLYDSPCHGFNLCVGSVGEGLRNPREEIIPILQWLGERGQIFNIHLRNIRGGWNNFQEVYPDNGDMDFVQVLTTLKNVGYAGMVMPDHVPAHSDPQASNQGFAFGYGYIKGILQALYGWDAYPPPVV